MEKRTWKQFVGVTPKGTKRGLSDTHTEDTSKRRDFKSVTNIFGPYLERGRSTSPHVSSVLSTAVSDVGGIPEPT